MPSPATKPASQPASRAVRSAAFFSRPLIRVTVGVLSYALAALLLSWAIDSGSLFDYTLAALLLLTGTRELVAAGQVYRKRYQTRP